MRKPKFKLALCLIVAGLLAVATPAHATLASITFVSATGSDSHPCTQASPCATFQQAISVTAPGGEVDALTAGNFGSFIICSGSSGCPGSLTIDGKGMATVQSTEQAIAVNVSSTDTVVLRGLSINGGAPSGSAAGIEGIYFPGGGNLIVEDCIITGFTYDGIVNVTNGTSLLYVKNTTINGGATGIYVNEDGGSTILEHVTITGASSYGVNVLNSPGTLSMNDSLIVGGAYGVNIQSSAYYGTSVFNTQLERVTIQGTTTTGFYLGVGSGAVDSSSFFSNAMAMETNGGSLRISNNNMYSNTYGIECVSASSKVQTDGNNRHGGPTGISTTGGCPAVTPVYVE